MVQKRKLILSISGITLVLGVVVWSLVNSPKPITAEPASLSWSGPPDNNIVYLLADDAAVADSPLAPANLQDKLGAKIAHTWAEVLAYNKTASIEALIIHDSALSLVDQAWLADAYRRGMIIAGFNLNGPQLADLVDDPCLIRDNFATEPYPGPFYVIVSFSIGGPDPKDVAIVKDNYRRSCGEISPTEEPAGYVSFSRGRSTDNLTNDNDFNVFVQTLMNHFR